MRRVQAAVVCLAVGSCIIHTASAGEPIVRRQQVEQDPSTASTKPETILHAPNLPGDWEDFYLERSGETHLSVEVDVNGRPLPAEASKRSPPSLSEGRIAVATDHTGENTPLASAMQPGQSVLLAMEGIDLGDDMEEEDEVITTRVR
mmetsp:Transcript_70926/g.169859  ORF Transcript_70926/g.169859 Transcript_70926/m.169859 type:complete len:147 (-) Transcript_70926:184-624(-)